MITIRPSTGDFQSQIDLRRGEVTHDGGIVEAVFLHNYFQGADEKERLMAINLSPLDQSAQIVSTAVLVTGLAQKAIGNERHRLGRFIHDYDNRQYNHYRLWNFQRRIGIGLMGYQAVRSIQRLFTGMSEDRMADGLMIAGAVSGLFAMTKRLSPLARAWVAGIGFAIDLVDLTHVGWRWREGQVDTATLVLQASLTLLFGIDRKEIRWEKNKECQIVGGLISRHFPEKSPDHEWFARGWTTAGGIGHFPETYDELAAVLMERFRNAANPVLLFCRGDQIPAARIDLLKRMKGKGVQMIRLIEDVEARGHRVLDRQNLWRRLRSDESAAQIDPKRLEEELRTLFNIDREAVLQLLRETGSRSFRPEPTTERDLFARFKKIITQLPD